MHTPFPACHHSHIFLLINYSNTPHTRHTSHITFTKHKFHIVISIILYNTNNKAYTGDRLRHTLDWSLSSVGDDVTSYTSKLSEMERRLFQRGALASANHMKWKLNGNRRLVLTNNNNASNKNHNNDFGAGSNKESSGNGEQKNNHQQQQRDKKRQRME